MSDQRSQLNPVVNLRSPRGGVSKHVLSVVKEAPKNMLKLDAKKFHTAHTSPHLLQFEHAARAHKKTETESEAAQHWKRLKVVCVNRLAVLLILVSGWMWLPQIGGTASYFNDVEGVVPNLFETVNLDMIVQYDMSQCSLLDIDDSADFHVSFESAEGGLPFVLSGLAQEVGTTSPFCEKLTLRVYRDGEFVYGGSLLDFMMENEASGDEWEFTVRYHSQEAQDEIPYGAQCNVDFVFTGICTNRALFGGGGFSDQEIVPLRLTKTRGGCLNCDDTSVLDPDFTIDNRTADVRDRIGEIRNQIHGSSTPGISLPHLLDDIVGSGSTTQSHTSSSPQSELFIEAPAETASEGEEVPAETEPETNESTPEPEDAEEGEAEEAAAAEASAGSGGSFELLSEVEERLANRRAELEDRFTSLSGN